MKNWDLSDLYKGFDEAYENDLKKLDKKIDDLKSYILYQKQENDTQYIEGYIKREEAITILSRTLGSFASLTMATNVNDENGPRYLAKMQQIFRKVTAEQVIFQRYLTSVDLDKLAEHSKAIRTYLYVLKREQDDAKHLLSEKEEVLYAKMREFASSSWGQLHSLTTANLPVDYDEKEITLSEVRNLAYDADPKVRKAAFEAELKAYEKIDDQVALALSNIKREVTTMNELRGYDSALSKTLFQSKMTDKTLNAMLSAMLEYRPYFAEYLKAKSKYLDHKGSLPFYDLFAPVGKLTKTYTYEEAQKIIKDAFYGYSKRLGDFATKAFDNNWVDPFPKKGKRGGAFCSNQPQIKQSRIMSNFTGSLSDVLTLAHELGHGYHGEVISDNKPLHWSYPMPLAETASIFCETIVNNYLLKQLSKDEEKLSVLENSLQGDTQVIIDILSRYIFETKLFEHSHGPINKNQMKALMMDAQKEAYTDGLNVYTLHPYMWLNKGHYYSAGLNFYNFPYAFGLLFGKGLYAAYLKNPDKFLNNYDDLLTLTTKTSVEEAANSMDIDVTSKDFWISSLEQVKKDIDEVISLFNK
ncbi:M3 family oligoendopeptidase [Mariniplasma anaerobium]|uniref:Oligoendopeptidase F n=1 Tax=Mariniplasma anaerobium TaxID=2735436 RepID=A0A7U9XVT4_9MOLU|nr:M3 family oligoendopeptidase [Mariniplasma anaerobium]BCR36075.1 oligoendopeptidase F [Mariniplasma anaerobium]